MERHFEGKLLLLEKRAQILLRCIAVQCVMFFLFFFLFFSSSRPPNLCVPQGISKRNKSLNDMTLADMRYHIYAATTAK